MLISTNRTHYSKMDLIWLQIWKHLVKMLMKPIIFNLTIILSSLRLQSVQIFLFTAHMVHLKHTGSPTMVNQVNKFDFCNHNKIKAMRIQSFLKILKNHSQKGSLVKSSPDKATKFSTISPYSSNLPSTIQIPKLIFLNKIIRTIKN